MGTRVVFDKRTLRKRYGAAFAAAILEYNTHGSFLDEVAQQLGGDPSPLSGEEPVKVFVRKRPLFREEAEVGEFDVVTACPHGSLIAACRMRADLRSPFLATHYSPLYAFDEHTTNEEVVARIGLDELICSAVEGSDSALCCFGQTGSGKSFTMAAVLQELSRLLFGPDGLLRRRQCTLQLCAYEVCGQTVLDLLSGGAKVRVRENKAGQVMLDAAAVDVADDAALRSLLHAANKSRRTAPTARNPGSSRSHAFYDLRFTQPPGQEKHRAGSSSCGSLLLVDLAGSERAADSAEHDMERQLQSAEINSGLSTLKECFRQRNVASRLAGSDASVHVPYRESMLSRLMKRVLEPTSRRAGGGAGGSGSGSMCGSGGECHQPRVVVIATISPCASDTEAGLNTLRHAAAMSGLRMDRDSDMLLEERDVDRVPSHAGGAAVGQAAMGVAAGVDSLPSIHSNRPTINAMEQGDERDVDQQATAYYKQQHKVKGQAAAGGINCPGAAPPAHNSNSARVAAADGVQVMPGSGLRRPAVVGDARFGDRAGAAACVDRGTSGSLAVANRTPPGASPTASTPAAGHPYACNDQDQHGSCGHIKGTPVGILTPPSSSGPCGGVASAGLSLLPPVKWSHADVVGWLAEAAGGRYKAAAAALPPSVDGKAFTRFPEVRFKQLFEGDPQAARRGHALYELFREEVRTHSAQRMQAARDIGSQADSSSSRRRRSTVGGW